MSVTAQKDWWNQKSRYHADRVPHSRSQVQSVLLPQLARYVPRTEKICVMDLACGGGSIGAEFVRQAAEGGYHIEKMILVDVVQDNVDAAEATLKKVFPSEKVATFLANGSDFRGYQGPKANFFYCWDAMVHFDLLDVAGYLKTLKDVASGIAFFHHSNYAKVTRDIRQNPHHRNFMTHDVFHQMCISSGYKVLEQRLTDWGGVQGLDCFTTVQIPG